MDSEISNGHSRSTSDSHQSCITLDSPISVLPLRLMDAKYNPEAAKVSFQRPHPVDIDSLTESPRGSTGPSTPSLVQWPKDSSQFVPGSHHIHYLFDQEEASPLHDIPLRSAPDGLVRMLCLTPTGSPLLWECAVSEPGNPIGLKQVLTENGVQSSSRGAEGGESGERNTWNLGILPQTLCAPYIGFRSHPLASLDTIMYDGRPIEVIDLAGDCRRFGEAYLLKPMGAYGVIDGETGVLSWKIVGIAGDHQLADSVQDLGDVEKYMPGILDRLQTWLKRSGLPNSDGVENALFHPTAGSHRSIILEAHCAWRDLCGDLCTRPAADWAYDPLRWSTIIKTPGGASLEPGGSVENATSATMTSLSKIPQLPTYLLGTNAHSTRGCTGIPSKSSSAGNIFPSSDPGNPGEKYDCVWADLERADEVLQAKGSPKERSSFPKSSSSPGGIQGRSRGGWPMISPRNLLPGRVTTPKFYLADDNQVNALDRQLSLANGLGRGDGKSLTSNSLGMHPITDPNDPASPSLSSGVRAATVSEARGSDDVILAVHRSARLPPNPRPLSPPTAAPRSKSVYNISTTQVAGKSQRKSMTDMVPGQGYVDALPVAWGRDSSPRSPMNPKSPVSPKSPQARIIPLSQEAMVMGSMGEEIPVQHVSKSVRWHSSESLRSASSPLLAILDWRTSTHEVGPHESGPRGEVRKQRLKGLGLKYKREEVEEKGKVLQGDEIGEDGASTRVGSP